MTKITQSRINVKKSKQDLDFVAETKKKSTFLVFFYYQKQPIAQQIQNLMQFGPPGSPFNPRKIGKSVFVLQVSNLSNVKPESQDFSCVCKANHTEKLGHFLSTEKAFFHSLGDDLRVVAKIIKLIYSKIKEDCTITEEATR